MASDGCSMVEWRAGGEGGLAAFALEPDGGADVLIPPRHSRAVTRPARGSQWSKASRACARAASSSFTSDSRRHHHGAELTPALKALALDDFAFVALAAFALLFSRSALAADAVEAFDDLRAAGECHRGAAGGAESGPERGHD